MVTVSKFPFPELDELFIFLAEVLVILPLPFHLTRRNITIAAGLSCTFLSGTPASIHYGTGAIAGFYSQDQVTIGNLVVQNQVLHFPCCYLRTSCHI